MADDTTLQPPSAPQAPAPAASVAQQFSPANIGAREAEQGTREAQHEQQRYSEEQALQGRLAAAESAPLPAHQQVPLPTRPTKPPIDGKQVNEFATALMAIAMLSTARGGQDRWINTLNSLNGAMAGFIQGNQAKAKQEYENYDRQFKEAMALQQQSDREYQSILEQRNKSINQISREMSIAAAKWGHVQMQDAAQRRSVDEMWRTANQMQIANERLKMQQESMNERIQAHHDAMNSHWQVMNNPATGELVRINAVTGEVQPFSADTKGFGRPSAGGAGGMGSRAEVFFNRMASAANEAAQAAANIMELPIGATFFDPGSASGVLDAGHKALTRELTPQEVQDYNVMIAGVTRNLAAIESSGLAPSGSLTGQMGAVEFHPGDSEMTKLRRMAEMRQIVEKGMEPYLANPRVPEEQKTMIRGINDTMAKAIPFTQHDLTEFQKASGGKSHTTLRKYMQQRGLDKSTPPLPNGQPAGVVNNAPIPSGWKVTEH